MKLERAPIICPPMPNRSTKVFGGEASGILNWNDIKHPHFYELREEVRANFWIAAEVDMGKDVSSFSLFMEQEEFLQHLALLAIHNPIQNDLSNEIADYATDPSVTSVFATFYDQVMEHGHALTYALTHLVTDKERQRELLKLDNLVVADRFDDAKNMHDTLRDEPTEKHILLSLAHLAVMKGLQMYSTLAYFYNVTEKNFGDMSSTSRLVGLVHRDRLTQLKFVTALFRVALSESEFSIEDLQADIIAMIEEEVRRENSLHTNEDVAGYIRYRANRILKGLTIDPIYPETSNSATWIEKYIELDTQKEEDTSSSNAGFDFYGFDDL